MKLYKAVMALLMSATIVLAQDVPSGFVDLQKAVPTVVVELRYSGENNFIGKPIDGYEARICYISTPAALALKSVQEKLSLFGFGLKVFDGYRPQRAVNHFVRWAKDLSDTKMKAIYYPNVLKSELFEKGYIAARSGHSRGSTVDLTLIDLATGKELDMGTGFDFFSPISWPTSKEVTSQQRANRLLLRSIMMSQGFRPLEEEWWHFTLANEPYPTTYFDFVVR
ncbi:MAG: M15 family metallopeptidase [Thiovulaceae bacterium]|nr:M15 family metallopeptidase [Sulfurimonadaceae bacterium]